MSDESCADRVEFDIAERSPHIGFIHRAGIETVLPEMSTALLQLIDTEGIALMGKADAAGESRFYARHPNYVDMVGHQAVTEYFQVGFAGKFFEKLKVCTVVAVSEEYLLAIVPALGYMVWRINDNRACSPWHTISIRQ